MEDVNDVFVGVSEVEYSCYLDVKILLIGLFALDALIYHMNLIVPLLLNFGVPLSQGLLKLCMVVLNLFSSVFDFLYPLLDRPAADCPTIDLVGYFFLGEELQEAFPLHVILQTANNAI